MATITDKQFKIDELERVVEAQALDVEDPPDPVYAQLCASQLQALALVKIAAELRKIHDRIHGANDTIGHLTGRLDVRLEALGHMIEGA